jgi:hypothetical protein
MVVAFMLLQFSIFLLMMCFSFILWIEFIQSLNLIRTQISLQTDKIIWKSNRFSLLIWLAGRNLFLLWTSPPGRSFLSPARCGSQPSGRWHCLNQAPLAHGSLPLLAALPHVVHRRPTGASRVRHAARTARRVLPVPVPTRPHPMLGEDFGVKKQNWGVIKN